MAKSLPPLTWFRSFEAAARTLSSTAAGQEIGLTQSAVSQQIKSLEVRLGVSLFHRHARGLSLTDAGRNLLPQVEAALDTLAAATLPFLGTGGTENLTVAASISVIEWVIAPALPTFCADHPDVTIRFVGTIWPDEFSAPRADVEIRFGSKRQVGKDAIPLEPNHLVALKSPDLDGTIKTLSLIETVGTSEGWRDWVAVNEGLKIAPTLFADSYGLSLRLAEQGNGVALVNSVIAGHALKRGQLEYAHPGRIAALQGYFLSVQSPTPTARAFGAWVQDICSASAEANS